MTPEDNTAERPPIWSGHVVAYSRDPRAAAPFWLQIGMREVAIMDDFAILELRGGTHLALRRDESHTGAPVGFDLMVEDLRATHAAWTEAGLEPTEVEVDPIHETFRVQDPDGNTITIFNTHVIGPV